MNTRLVAALTAVLIGTAACGGGDGDTKTDTKTDTKADSKADSKATHHGSAAPTASQQAGRNAQDVMFAQMMIPHHRQAVEMSDVVLKGSTDPEVRRLAEQIRKAQAPEIETMTGWLREWGAPVPDEKAPATGHAGHGGMAGMMTPEQMAAFGKLKGKELDRRFLTMMIEHHEGAVTMAKDEQAKGAHAGAKAMAAEIIRTQQAEIAEMRKMLKN